MNPTGAVDLSRVNWDPSTVNRLHQQSDVDTRPNAQHHTLGNDANQAAPGNHRHTGAANEGSELSAAVLKLHKNVNTVYAPNIDYNVIWELSELNTEPAQWSASQGDKFFPEVNGFYLVTACIYITTSVTYPNTGGTFRAIRIYKNNVLQCYRLEPPPPAANFTFLSITNGYALTTSDQMHIGIRHDTPNNLQIDKVSSYVLYTRIGA